MSLCAQPCRIGEGSPMTRRSAPAVGPFLRVLAAAVVAITNALFKRDYRNLDGVPARGPVILAVNHISYADPLVVARFCWDAGRVPRFLAKSSLFTIPVIGWVIGKAGQIPVDRGSRDAARSLTAAAEALRSGDLVAVYPEGTVTRDADFWPMTGKTGLARLALLAPNAVVIPVGQWGAQESVDWYRKKFRPSPRKTVRLSVGAPVDLTRFYGRDPSAATLRELTDTVMGAVREQVAVIRSVRAPGEPAGDGSPAPEESGGEA
jgi:1-acyl-sn-glycerol-3-phosphate acyltransferase